MQLKNKTFRKKSGNWYSCMFRKLLYPVYRFKAWAARTARSAKAAAEWGSGIGEWYGKGQELEAVYDRIVGAAKITPRDRAIVEAGCGGARLLGRVHALHPHQKVMLGLDISSKALGLARGHLSRIGGIHIFDALTPIQEGSTIVKLVRSDRLDVRRQLGRIVPGKQFGADVIFHAFPGMLGLASELVPSQLLQPGSEHAFNALEHLVFCSRFTQLAAHSLASLHPGGRAVFYVPYFSGNEEGMTRAVRHLRETFGDAVSVSSRLIEDRTSANFIRRLSYSDFPKESKLKFAQVVMTSKKADRKTLKAVGERVSSDLMIGMLVDAGANVKAVRIGGKPALVFEGRRIGLADVVVPAKTLHHLWGPKPPTGRGKKRR